MEVDFVDFFGDFIVNLKMRHVPDVPGNSGANRILVTMTARMNIT